jgi:hypothetical protein
MKIKTLLIAAISITTFLFTSCERDEMDKGGQTGGGELPGADMKVVIKDIDHINESTEDVKIDSIVVLTNTAKIKDYPR